MREQDHIANGRRIGQKHYQTVNPDTLAGGRRHAVFQGADEVGVIVHGLVVTGVLVGHLLQEARGLVFGVIQL